MFKRIGILFLVILLCMGSLTSCLIVINDKSEGGETTAPTPETSAETKAPIEKVPPMTDVMNDSSAGAEKALEGLFADTKYPGQTLTVMVAEDTSLDLHSEQELSSERGLKLQAELISKKLECVVYINRIPYNTFLSDAQAAINAGLFYADVVCVPQKGIGYMKNEKMLADLNKLYGDIFVEDCYNIDAKQQASVNSSLYAIAGDGSLNPGAVTCVYLNKAISGTYGITESIYEAVANGTWTLDSLMQFRNMCTVTHEDLVAIGAVSAETAVEALFGGTGMKYFNTGAGTMPKVADNGARMDSFTAKMRGILADPLNFMWDEDISTQFEQEKCMFYIDTLEKASKLKGDYTVLPLPKLNETQDKYYTHVTDNAYVYAVLTNNNRPEYAPVLIRLLNETDQLLFDGYSRDLLDYALRNEQSYKNIREMFKTPNYQFAYMYGQIYNSIADGSYNALMQAVRSETSYKTYADRQNYNLQRDLKKLFS